MTLNKQQSDFLAAIFSQQLQQENEINNFNVNVNTESNTTADEQTNQQGLQIYQHSLLANATRALTITFATVASFTGEAAFTALVKEYLQCQLKSEFDWGVWGASFANFISESNVENAHLLAEVAALDFACHQCERAENKNRDLASMQLLSNTDAYQLSLGFCAGMSLLKFSFPLDELIAELEQLNTENNHLSLEEITEWLSRFNVKHAVNKSLDNNADEYYFLIWRPEFQAQYAQIDHTEYQWLSLWLANEPTENLSIGQALDEMSSLNFSIVDWLPKAIEQQLLNAIKLHD